MRSCAGVLQVGVSVFSAAFHQGRTRCSPHLLDVLTSSSVLRAGAGWTGSWAVRAARPGRAAQLGAHASMLVDLTLISFTIGLASTASGFALRGLQVAWSLFKVCLGRLPPWRLRFPLWRLRLRFGHLLLACLRFCALTHRICSSLLMCGSHLVCLLLCCLCCCFCCCKFFQSTAQVLLQCGPLCCRLFGSCCRSLSLQFASLGALYHALLANLFDHPSHGGHQSPPICKLVFTDSANAAPVPQLSPATMQQPLRGLQLLKNGARQAFSLYVIDGNVAEISHQVQSGSQVNNVCASHRTGQRAQ
mmetsp:Transcript_4087/g.11015  ORF Transcript_4087/g.11015 Transcript_4087/m.11015 type:complete len:304 (+) Transcript_4087:1430-2341(+)